MRSERHFSECVAVRPISLPISDGTAVRELLNTLNPIRCVSVHNSVGMLVIDVFEISTNEFSVTERAGRQTF